MTEQDFDIIEKYLAGQLSPEERFAFQQRLAQEKDLREQAAVFTSLQLGIKQYGRRDLRKHVFPPPEIPFMVRLSTVWKVAIPAGIVAIILIYRTFTHSTGEQMFLAYYAPADTIYFSTPRGESEDHETKVNAFKEFKKGEYDAAQAILNKLSAMDEEAFLLSGLNNIQQQNYEDAIKTLLKAKEGNPRISHTASWYLALIYLKQGDKANAMNELKLVAGSESEFKGRAAEIMEALVKR